jgi:hypothetical protein
VIASRFSPCGMRMDDLRACYSTKFRVFIDGQERIVPARWFFCAPGAKDFPVPHSFFSRVWDKPWEAYDDEPGESTIWKGLDRGINPGYPGQCVIGDLDWFASGQLPAGIDAPPADSVPACCIPPHATAAGGLQLGGSATAEQVTAAIAAGGLQLGGSATADQVMAVMAGGGLVIGGAAATQAIPGSGTGSGSGSGSGGSGGDDTQGCDQCPDGAARQYGFSLNTILPGLCADCTNMDRSYVLTYRSGCNWQSSPIIVCGSTNDTWQLEFVGGVVQLDDAITGVTYTAPAAGWNCVSPLVMSRGFTGAKCLGWPPTITINPV